jgi:hypothetical protein
VWSIVGARLRRLAWRGASALALHPFDALRSLRRSRPAKRKRLQCQRTESWRRFRCRAALQNRFPTSRFSAVSQLARMESLRRLSHFASVTLKRSWPWCLSIPLSRPDFLEFERPRAAFVNGFGGAPVRFASSGSGIIYPVRHRDTDNLWLQHLDGSPGKQPTDFKSELIRDFDWSFDGKQIVLNDLLRSGARPVGFLVSRKLSDDICRLDTLPLKREWDGDPEVEGTLNRLRDRFIEGGQKRGAWLRLPRQ